MIGRLEGSDATTGGVPVLEDEACLFPVSSGPGSGLFLDTIRLLLLSETCYRRL